MLPQYDTPIPRFKCKREKIQRKLAGHTNLGLSGEVAALRNTSVIYDSIQTWAFAHPVIVRGLLNDMRLMEGVVDFMSGVWGASLLQIPPKALETSGSHPLDHLTPNPKMKPQSQNAKPNSRLGPRPLSAT